MQTRTSNGKRKIKVFHSTCVKNYYSEHSVWKDIKLLFDVFNPLYLFEPLHYFCGSVLFLNYYN